VGARVVRALRPCQSRPFTLPHPILSPPPPHNRPGAPPFCSIIILFFIGVVCLCVYHLQSDGDFSFLMTLGSLLVLAGFGLLVAKLVVTRGLANVSFKTLHAYALVFFARLCSILNYEGYLPFDRSGDWFYQTVEVSALVVTLALIGATWALKLKAPSDKFDAKLMERVGLPAKYGVVVLAVPALFLAALLHPSLNNNWLTDVAWTFALYLEAVAIWPQLYIFAKEDPMKEIEPLEINFVFSLAGAWRRLRRRRRRRRRQRQATYTPPPFSALPPPHPPSPLIRVPQWPACCILFFG
jgi:hypothetical protein